MDDDGRRLRRSGDETDQQRMKVAAVAARHGRIGEREAEPLGEQRRHAIFVSGDAKAEQVAGTECDSVAAALKTIGNGIAFAAKNAVTEPRGIDRKAVADAVG